MKTMVNKTKATLAFALLALGMNAQSTQMKKACIKIETEDNGKVVKIDTCVTAATEEELQQKLNAIGAADMLGLPPIPEIPPVPGGEGQQVSVTKTIIIDDGSNDNSGKKQKVKVVSSSGKDDEVIVMDENGSIVSSDADGASVHVVVKHLKQGEKLDPETEKLLKANGIDIKDGGEGKQAIISRAKGKNGKESKEVKVIIYEKVDVQNLSDADKKLLPAGASKSMATASPFTNLTVSPNPTDDACIVSYNSSSKEPLQIKAYDTNGKTVYTETDKNVSEHVNKTLSLKDLGEGIYFIHITQGKQSEIRKIVMVKH